MSYQKHDFKNGQVLTAEHLNEIEDGIVAIEEEAVSSSELSIAVNDALALAKASGEFNGRNGDDYVLTEADKAEIAEMTAENIDLTGYATEQFVRDGFQPKGNYLTEVPDGYAKTTDIPTKVSELTNDSGFITEDKVNGLYIVETAAGEIIQLDDAADMELAGLRIFGKTTQYTSTGKNLLDLSDAVEGYAISAEGEIIEASNISYTKLISLPVGTYTFSVETKSSPENIHRVHVYDSSGSWLRQAGSIRERYTVFTIAEGEYGVRVSFNPANKIQIETGSVATAFEPYTAGNHAPSPAYPIPLNSAGDGGSVNVTVNSRNLFGGELLADRFVEEVSAKKDEVARTVTYEAKSMSGAFITRGLKFKPNTRYTIIFKYTATSETINMRVYYTDDSYDIFRPGSASSFTTWVFVTDDNKTVSRISGSYNSGTTVLKYDECGIFEGVLTADEFEPYNRQTLTIQKPEIVDVFLPGLPVESGGNYTDENGQQWICDEVDFASGKYVQSINTAVLDGTGWKINSAVTGNIAHYYRNLPEASVPRGFIMSSMLTLDSRTATTNSSIVNICEVTTSGASIAVDVSAEEFPNVESWMNYLQSNPMTVQYQLAEPIEHDLSPDELAQYAALHTIYPNTTIYNDGGAGMEVKYVADTKLYIDKKFAELAEAILNN